MFQGLKKLRQLNWEPLSVNPETIDVVLLTHGHLDHVGYLPRLVKAGFSGKIIGTSPTLEIAKIILEDSAKIQEEDAAYANKKGYSKHKTAQPLYNLKDVEKTIPHFEEQPLNNWIQLFEGISYRFRYNGHIIGATFIEMDIAGKRFVFSGDIGRENDVLLRSPDKPDSADILFIESTYGNRIHPVNPEGQLADVINNAAKRNGTIIIPSFAVERTQSLMYIIWQLIKKKEIPNIPVYMDSPMGRNVLEVFQHNTDWHKLSAKDCLEMCYQVKLIKTIEETQNLIEDNSPKIVIAGSGMATGGRVLGYFQKYLSDSNATILLVGYQAEGTRGRQLLEGASEIKLHGKYYQVKAKIENIQGLSAHADQKELLDWLSNIKQKPERVFIVHGEAQAADVFRVKLKDTYGWDAEIAELNQIITL
jgi:metallo-beta-lactamase family protein